MLVSEELENTHVGQWSMAQGFSSGAGRRQRGWICSRGFRIQKLDYLRREAGTQRRGRFRSRSESLPSLCCTDLSLGMPYFDGKKAQRTRRCRIHYGARSPADRKGLALRWRSEINAGYRRRSPVRSGISIPDLFTGETGLHRPDYRACIVGQEKGNHRQQRIIRDHSYAE